MKGIVFLAVCTVVLMLLPGAGVISAHVGEISPGSTAILLHTCNDGEIDQSQEKDNGAEKFYGGIWLAQSFKPNADNLTGVSIKVNKYIEDDSIDCERKAFHKSNEYVTSRIGVLLFRLFSFFKPFFSIGRFSAKDEHSASRSSLDGLESLTISVCEMKRGGEIGEPLRTKTFSADEISNESTWLMFDFSDDPIYDASDFYGKYCIVCHAEGGNSSCCFNWSFGYGDPYNGGLAYLSGDNGSEYKVLSGTDFCFRSYGTNWSEEPDDEVKRFAILVWDPNSYGAEKSANTMRDTLCTDIWDSKVDGEQRIWVFSRDEMSEVTTTLKDLDKKEDKNDIILLFYKGHTLCPFCNKYVNRLGGAVVVILDTCYAGSFSGRFPRAEMLMSARADEKSYLEPGIGGIFTYYVCQALRSSSFDPNNDGWVSAEEAFNYAAPRTTERSPNHQHPVFYDGYPGDIPITKV